MKLERSIVGGRTVIGISEPLEINLTNCDEFKSGFLSELTEDDTSVILDASLIEFFDSAGMSSLLSLQKELKQRQGLLVLAGLKRQVLEVFQMLGFDSIFHSFADIGPAAEFLNQRGSTQT
jgi:anti-sigma B factor antagonist